METTQHPGLDNVEEGEEEEGSLHIEVNTALFLVLALVSLIIIFGNGFTMAVIITDRRLRDATGYLMTSLALADMGVGLTAVVPLLYAAFTDTLSTVACDVMGFLNSVTWVVSVYTLTLLSADRYVAITSPLRYHSLVTDVKVGVAIAAVWCVGGFLWLLPLVGVGAYKFNDEEATCYFNVGRYPNQWIVYMVVIFAPAIVISGFCYGRMWQISRNTLRQVDVQTNDENKKTVGKNYKALRTILCIVGAFYVTWLPFIIEHLVKAAKGKLEDIPEWLEIAIYVLAVSNSFLNPLIYLGTNRVFRRAAVTLAYRATCQQSVVAARLAESAKTTLS